MIDLISVLGTALSGIGVLQGVKNKRSLIEKVSTLQEGVDQVMAINSLLDTAKEVHDKFQMVEVVVVTPLLTSVRRERNDLDNITESVRIALGQLIYFEIKELVFSDDKSINYTQVSVNIKSDLQNISSIIKELSEAIVKYSNEIYVIKQLFLQRNFGSNFDNSLIQFSDVVRRGLVSADHLILKLIPVIKFLNLQVKTAVSELYE